MRQIASFLLIIGFFVVLLPREVFHSHDSHHEESSHVEEDAELVIKNHCFACDLDLSLFTEAKIVKFKFDKITYPSIDSIDVQSGEKGFSLITQLRGPPQFI